MRDDSYIVQFQRRDGQPNEEYYYNTRDEAEKHLRLFHGDDSGLYRRIVLLAWVGDVTTELRSIEFGNG